MTTYETKAICEFGVEVEDSYVWDVISGIISAKYAMKLMWYKAAAGAVWMFVFMELWVAAISGRI